MKTLFAIGLLLAASLVAAAQPPASVVKGKVLEVKDVESYTYLRLQTKDGETWAAVSKATVKKDAEVTIENITVMSNFESKSLRKTFPTILFGSLGGSAAQTQGWSDKPAAAHGAVAPALASRPIKVDKATGANARTIAEIITRADTLNEKPVLVRGQVVKYTPDIMGKNWLHLQDGSGSAADKSHDILLTTSHQAKIGEVLTFKGIVRTNKDFGAGYSYKVLIEEGVVQP